MKDFLAQICRRCHNGADHSEPAPIVEPDVVVSGVLRPLGWPASRRTPYVVKSEKLLIVE